MTVDDGPDEPEQGMPPITWRQVVVPDLLEARIVTGDDGDGGGIYAGYVARTTGRSATWYGYVGLQHESVGRGSREAMQAAVERAAREAWTARQARQDRGG